MKKVIFAVTASILFIVGSVIVVNSIPRDSLNQWSVGTDALGLTLNSSGVLLPQVDDANDIGSSTYQFKDMYLDGTLNSDGIINVGTLSQTGAVTTVGDVAITGDLRFNGLAGRTPTDLIVSSATHIVPASSFVLLRSTETLAEICTFSRAHEIIDVTNFVSGDYVIFTTTTTVGFIFTEGAATGMYLGGTTRTVGQYDMLTLVYVTTSTVVGSGWFQELDFVAN